MIKLGISYKGMFIALITYFELTGCYKKFTEASMRKVHNKKKIEKQNRAQYSLWQHHRLSTTGNLY